MRRLVYLLLLGGAFGAGGVLAEVMLPNTKDYAEVVRSTRAQLLQTVTWIEFYKTRMGYYPMEIQDAVPHPHEEPKVGVYPAERSDRDTALPDRSTGEPIGNAYPRLPVIVQSRVPLDVVDATVWPRPMALYYRRVGNDRYYLRAVGPDGKPFTGDDIYPDIESEPGSRLGLLISGPQAPSSLEEAAVIEGPDGR